MILRPVRSGDKLSIPADVWNALQRMLREWLGNEISSIGENIASEPDVVWVRNSSGEDLNRFAVLSIDDMVFTPDDNPTEFSNKPIFDCVKPTDNAMAYVVTTAPVKDGDLVRGVISGVTPATVYMNRSDDAWAEPAGNQTYLQSNAVTGSAQILWCESWGTEDTGQQKAIVRLGNQRSRWVTFHISPIGATTGLGNGKYFAESVALPTTPADFSPSGNMTDLEIGPTVAGADCIVMNMLELGHSNSGHDLVDDINTGAWELFGVGEWIHNAIVGNTTYKVLRAAQFWKGCQ